jgi:hypothetical protein
MPKIGYRPTDRDAPRSAEVRKIRPGYDSLRAPNGRFRKTAERTPRARLSIGHEPSWPISQDLRRLLCEPHTVDQGQQDAHGLWTFLLKVAKGLRDGVLTYN